MANLREIKKRIGSVKSTQQITRAMKMVSGAKLRRAEERIAKFRPYAEELSGTMAAMIAKGLEISHPLTEAGVSTAPTLLVLVTSDRGLCAAFNSNVGKQAQIYIEQQNLLTDAFAVYTVGKKASEIARRRGWTVLGSSSQIPEPPTAEFIGEIMDGVVQPFIDGAVSNVVLVNNRFVNALTQLTQTSQLLPLSASSDSSNNLVPFLTEPDPEALLKSLAPRIVEAMLESAVLDSLAGEHGARMTAMDSATTNASEMIQKLTLTYNRARQAAITSELLDIVNGANSID